MYAAAKHIDNLVAIIDYNKKQIDGSTDDVCSLGDLKAKYESFGWTVYERLLRQKLRNAVPELPRPDNDNPHLDRSFPRIRMIPSIR